MKAELVHHVPGRVRLRVAEAKDSVVRMAALERRLAELAPVNDVAGNPVTASLVIRYDASRESHLRESLGELFPGLERAGRWKYRPSSNGHARTDALADDITMLFSAVDRQVETRIGAPGLKVLVPLLLAGFGLLLLARGLMQRRLPVPRWYDLFWFALGTFFMLNNPLGQPTDDQAPPKTVA
jgi:hypothetical protein